MPPVTARRLKERRRVHMAIALRLHATETGLLSGVFCHEERPIDSGLGMRLSSCRLVTGDAPDAGSRNRIEITRLGACVGRDGKSWQLVGDGPAGGGQPRRGLMGELRDNLRIPIAISARHAHLCQQTIDALFGPGYRLQPRNPLKQVEEYAAQETIALVGRRGRIEHVRVLGPPRTEDQIEISRTDEMALGIRAPLRISGDLVDTPGVTLEGPRGRVSLTGGLVCALRHIHMSPVDAVRLGVHDHDVVRAAVDGKRSVIFGNVVIRVAEAYQLELHLDTDEGNAAGVEAGDMATILRS